MPAAPPTAPPRKRKPITKQDISSPTDFRHCAHVGLDFNSEDVKNAIKAKTTDRQASTDNVYESVNRQETPILIASSQEETCSPPVDFAPEYTSNKDSGPSTASLNTVLPPPPATKPSRTKGEVLNYENRPSTHIYQNINNGPQQPRPSKKKNPPPPPPQADKPKVEPEEPMVAFRKISTKEAPVEEAPKIETPKRIEAAPASIIVERPGLLGEMRLGLDDPIPLTTGLPSKYRSPSMLTPKDAPTPLKTEENEVNKEDAPSRRSRPLIKESAIDLPLTPSAELSKMIIPEPLHEPKRIAPPPPIETAEPPRVTPYVPVSAAHSSSQLKNVISELKTKQSKEDVVEELNEEEEGNEYVSVSHKEMRKLMPPVQETAKENSEEVPMPVPKPRRTVATTSVDVVEEEKTSEKKLEELEDDGISSGCSDEDTEVIRL